MKEHCAQVLLRLQWERQVVRGQSMHMDASLDGLGVSVMGGLQDELFNLTMDRIQVQGLRARGLSHDSWPLQGELANCTQDHTLAKGIGSVWLMAEVRRPRLEALALMGPCRMSFWNALWTTSSSTLVQGTS